MTEEAKKRLAEKETRYRTAIALKEADRVPIEVNGYIYAVLEAGYTVGEIIYDPTFEKFKDAAIKYMLKYDPDTAMTGFDLGGEGPALDILGPKYIDWAGRPGTKIDINSMKQFLEFPILEDDEFEQFFNDRTGWKIEKSMPKLSRLGEIAGKLRFPMSHHGEMREMIESFAQPEVLELVEKCRQVSEYYKELDKTKRRVIGELAELGFPMFAAGWAAVPFDTYSDDLRGTILSLTDMYENPEYVQRFIDEQMPRVIEQIKSYNKDGSRDGKFVHMALHKGLDGFMSDENYVKYYWRHLQEIIQTIVDCNMVPYIFCEGRYSTRISHLKDIPRGKVIYKFEDTPMELVKKELGDVACITGGFPNTLLDHSSKEKVVDECKRMLDLCAPGGGFIFQTKSSLTISKRENVEALFETVKEYGKY